MPAYSLITLSNTGFIFAEFGRASGQILEKIKKMKVLAPVGLVHGLKTRSEKKHFSSFFAGPGPWPGPGPPGTGPGPAAKDEKHELAAEKIEQK